MWEEITGADPRTRRMAVPGGWLYQVEHQTHIEANSERSGYWIICWHAPVFVAGLHPDQIQHGRPAPTWLPGAGEVRR